MRDATKHGTGSRLLLLPGQLWAQKRAVRKQISGSDVRRSSDVPAKKSHGADSSLAKNQLRIFAHLTPEFSGGRAAAVV